MKRSTAELWVKIIAILGYITAAFAVLIGIGLILGGTFLSGLTSYFGEEILGGFLIGTFIMIAAILIIAYGVLTFIVALNLWKHKNWARIIMIVIAALGLIGSIPSIIAGVGIVTLVINGGIIYLLALNKDIVKLFR